MKRYSKYLDPSDIPELREEYLEEFSDLSNLELVEEYNNTLIRYSNIILSAKREALILAFNSREIDITEISYCNDYGSVKSISFAKPIALKEQDCGLKVALQHR